MSMAACAKPNSDFLRPVLRRGNGAMPLHYPTEEELDFCRAVGERRATQTQAGTQVYRVADGKLAETLISFRPAGILWTDVSRRKSTGRALRLFDKHIGIPGIRTIKSGRPACSARLCP
jgi:hypothetical protein